MLTVPAEKQHEERGDGRRLEGQKGVEEGERAREDVKSGRVVERKGWRREDRVRSIKTKT